MTFLMTWIDCLTLIDDSDEDSDYVQKNDENINFSLLLKVSCNQLTTLLFEENDNLQQ